jgi:drug/metabolite transporter (DMT)-like permease
MAFGYFGARIIDAVFVAIMALLILFQIPLADEYLQGGTPESVHALSAAIPVGLGLASLGYSLWSERRSQAQQAVPATERALLSPTPAA